MKHGAAIVFVEDARARHLVAVDLLLLVIVFDIFVGLVVLEGDVEIEIEIAAEGRHPREAPAHAPLEGLDLGKRRAGDCHERHVALGEVDEGAVEMIGKIGAALAAFLPVRPQHEVVDDELAPAVE